MKKTILTLKFCVLIMAVGLVTSCSQTELNNDSKSTRVREDVLSMGITFTNEMKDSVNSGDMDIKEEIEDLAYELKVVCVENNDYKTFSDNEMVFVDTLGEIRIAYDEVVFTRNPKYNKSEEKREAALDTFNQLVSTFNQNYTK